MTRRGQDILLGGSVEHGRDPAGSARCRRGRHLAARRRPAARPTSRPTFGRCRQQRAGKRELQTTAALIGAGVALAFALAGIALLWRPQLSLHGTARWAEPGELRRAGLLARRAEEVRGPIWGKLGSPKSRAPYGLGDDRAFAGGGADQGREGVIIWRC